MAAFPELDRFEAWRPLRRRLERLAECIQAMENEGRTDAGGYMAPDIARAGAIACVRGLGKLADALRRDALASLAGKGEL